MKKLLILLAALTLCNCTSIQKLNPSQPKKVSVITTAYATAEKDHKKYGNKTAIGTKLVPNKSAAANWAIYPVGTKLKIGEITYQIDDFGSYVIGKVAKSRNVPTVDIYQPSLRAMQRWGVRRFDDVEIVEMGSYEKSLTILQHRLKYKHCREMYYQIKSKI